MTSTLGASSRPRAGSGRHRAAAARRSRRWPPRHGRAALLLVSIGVTALIGVLGAVRPAERTSPGGETSSAWGEGARLDPLSVPAPPEDVRPVADPDPRDFPQSGEGTFVRAQALKVEGSGGGRDRSVTIEVEDGLEHDPAVFAENVVAVLGDERGWRADGWSFTHVEKNADVRILLSSPDTVDRLCAPLLTRGEVSCRAGDLVVLNVKRWALGVPYYDDLDDYRAYLVNHEVGHALGKYHVGCPSPGAKAPVMLQQTKGLQGCTANPWVRS